MYKFLVTLYIFIASWGFTTSAMSANIKDYAIALKSYKYSEAKKIAENFEALEKKHATELTQLLYNRGFKKITVDTIQYDDETYISKILYLLKKGYSILQDNSASSEPFKLFNDAFLIASETRDTELEKLTILAIFDVFNTELEQVQDQYRAYVKRYKALSTDNVDLFLLEYHKVNFLHDKTSKPLNNTVYTALDNAHLNVKNNIALQALYYVTRAYTYELNQDYNRAYNTFKTAISYAKQKPFLQFIIFRSYIRISDVFRKRNEPLLALKYLDTAKNYRNAADTIESNYYLNIYNSKNNLALKNYEKAYEQLHNTLLYSLDVEANKNSKNISQLSVLYGTEKKEKENLILQKQKTQNQNIALGLGGTLLLGGIIAFLVFKNTKRKQKLAEQEKQLESQKLATLLKEQELIAIDAMIEGQEKERQQIANDLHDDLGGLMATVKLHFNALTDNPSKELYTKTNHLIDEAYQKVRSVAHAKNSGVIAKQGLLTAVKHMAEKVSTSNKIKLDVIDHGLDNRLENSLELTLFRIIQELITNVVKHANATEATIHITNHEDAINIMVEDNGKGFNPKQITKTAKGMGISSIDKRVEHLDGQLIIESEINKGTTIILDIPL